MAWLAAILLALLRPGLTATGLADGGPPGGHHVVVLLPGDGALSSPGARDLCALLSRGPPPHNDSVADCLQQRPAHGDQTCWARAPCLSQKSFTDEDTESYYNGIWDTKTTCDMLLYWLEDFQTEKRTNESTDKLSNVQVWGYGILSTGLISLSGIGGIVLYPIMTKGYFTEVMNFLIGLAFGSLSATSIFQLIPESFGVIECDEDYLLKASICWCCIWIFYNIGVLTTIISGKRKHCHGHSHGHPSENRDAKSISQHPPGNNVLEMSTFPGISEEEEKNVFLNTTERVDFSKGEKVSSKKVTAVMIILGDGLHNFVDGMSIGAGYSQSLVTGLGISIGIACEEFPHEFGDFAVLIKSGFSFKKALKFNYATASTIFLGLITGISLGQLDGSIYIYAFAGGLFLYISLGELVPELKDMMKEEKAKGFKPTVVAYSLQNLGMIMGALAIFLVTKYA